MSTHPRTAPSFLPDFLFIAISKKVPPKTEGRLKTADSAWCGGFQTASVSFAVQKAGNGFPVGGHNEGDGFKGFGDGAVIMV